MAEKKEKAQRKEGGLAPWRPFGELETGSGLFGEWSFSRRFPRILDELLREWPALGRGQGFVPALDVHEDDGHYVFSVELPGVRKDDIHVELQEGLLTVRGEKTSEREEKKEQRRYSERFYGSFSRSFRLPPDADAERLDASFKDGVLTIRIPKTEEAKPRSIAIKAG